MFSFDLSNTDWWIVILAIFALILVRLIMISVEYFGENKRVMSLVSMMKELNDIEMNDQEEIEYLKFREYVFRSLPKKTEKKKHITPLMVCMIVWAAMSAIGYIINIHVINFILLFILLFIGGIIGNISYEIGLIKGSEQETKSSLEQASKKRVENTKH